MGEMKVHLWTSGNETFVLEENCHFFQIQVQFSLVKSTKPQDLKREHFPFPIMILVSVAIKLSCSS